ncbi:MAG: nitrate ABC transporter substrate-binding protein [Pseudanabaena frigida]|uniref:Nitrate ABC transporter substrate-binding protein n=1 Tax=Pseudanabaena frigida TaxID=945775 RepID=A0A2W4W3M1_9CYAN|nr:MAG: nitrate ABC transporter substrate-binding protein [Pseudanabaena frigida]
MLTTNIFSNINKKLYGTVFVIALVLTILVNACSQSQELKTLRVGINNWPGYTIALYANEAKLFEKRGIKVELIRFNNQQDSIRATIRGSQDMSFVPLWEVMQVDPSNDKPVIVLVTDISAGSDGIVARKGIESIRDLKGKKVGLKLGTVTHLILLEALKHNQIKPTDIEIYDISNERGAELLKLGSLDAAVLWEPSLSQTAQEIGGKVIFTTKDVDSLVIDSLVISANSLQSNKDEITKFILAWFDAIHAVETTPEKVFESISKQIKQPVETVARDYRGLKKGDIPMNQRMFALKGRLLNAIQESANLLREDLRHGRVIREDIEINSEPLLTAIKNWKP